MPRTPRKRTVKGREEGDELASELNVWHLDSQIRLVEARSPGVKGVTLESSEEARHGMPFLRMDDDGRSRRKKRDSS